MINIIKEGEDLSRVFSRSQLNMEEKNAQVKAIIKNVRDYKDKAIFEYTEKFDGIKLDKNSVMLTEEEIENAVKNVPLSVMKALKRAKENITEFHKRQIRKDDIVTKDGVTTGCIMRPVNRAGIYVPGGKASYPSSVLMCAVPALVAGVKEIVMASPGGANLNSATIAAAWLCGVKRIFRVGGAQAIAGLAFGTESIPKVDVISGPGNIYVALAKREVFGEVGIDMIAGPSEILIIADSTANPKFLAADMLSQAEHDELAMSMLITDNTVLAYGVQTEIERQIKLLPKREIARASLDNYGTIVITENLEKAVDLANAIAPEHLELCVNNSDEFIDKIKNAGAVFIGNYSPEPTGDYYAGTNHVLPTSGTARFFSALSVDTYMKKISLIKYSENALLKAADDIIILAEAEGLTAHANSIRVRKGDL